jgi:hypothetical protein
MIDHDALHLPSIRHRVSQHPVCELIQRDGHYCRGIAVAATFTPNGWRSRCSRHVAPDEPRICIHCRELLAATDTTVCGRHERRARA